MRADFLVLRKAFKMLDGLARDPAPNSDPDAILTAAVIREVVRLLPFSGLQLPASRGHRLHLSNLEVASAFGLAPLRYARAAGRLWFDGSTTW